MSELTEKNGGSEAEQISFRISRDLKRKFRAKLAHDGLDVTNVLRQFVEDTIKDSADNSCSICANDPPEVVAIRKLLQKRSRTADEERFLRILDILLEPKRVKD